VYRDANGEAALLGRYDAGVGRELEGLGIQVGKKVSVE